MGDAMAMRSIAAASTARAEPGVTSPAAGAAAGGAGGGAGGTGSTATAQAGPAARPVPRPFRRTRGPRIGVAGGNVVPLEQHRRRAVAAAGAPRRAGAPGDPSVDFEAQPLPPTRTPSIRGNVLAVEHQLFPVNRAVRSYDDPAVRDAEPPPRPGGRIEGTVGAARPAVDEGPCLRDQAAVLQLLHPAAAHRLPAGHQAPFAEQEVQSPVAVVRFAQRRPAPTVAWPQTEQKRTAARRASSGRPAPHTPVPYRLPGQVPRRAILMMNTTARTATAGRS